jgi:hypothetical protein
MLCLYLLILFLHEHIILEIRSLSGWAQSLNLIPHVILST